MRLVITRTKGIKMDKCKHAYKLRNGDYWCFNSAKGYFNKPCKSECCKWLKWYKEFTAKIGEDV